MPFDGTKLNETAQKLIQAKQYIEEHGWCQGQEINQYGSVCMVGALIFVGARRKRSFITAVLGGNVITWNDQPGRTVAEVYQAFDQAIALAIEEG